MAKFSDLYKAVQKKDHARLQELVRSGIGINSRDSKGRTVLHHAVEHSFGDNSLIEKLVEMGADVDAADIQGKTPLHYTLSEVCTDFIIHCLRNSLLPAVPREFQEKFAFSMIETIQIQTIECLLKLGADINARFDRNITSLHRAVCHECSHGIEILSGLGVPVNLPYQTGCQVLHEAIFGLKTNLVTCLVELGADVNSSYGASVPIHEVVALGRLDLFRLLLKYGADIHMERMENITPVIQVFEVRNRELMESLMECLIPLGADLSKTTKDVSVLYEIVREGRADMLECLSSHLSDTDKLSLRGLSRRTALSSAVRRDDYEMAQLLLKNGADVNAVYDRGMSPLELGVRLGSVDIVRALVRLGFRIYSLETENNTSVLGQVVQSTAFASYMPRMIKLLLKYGVNPNLEFDCLGLLHVAVNCGNQIMVRLLAELGADVDLIRFEGMTLLSYLLLPANRSNMSMIRTLVEAGIDIDATINFRVSPLHDAVRRGDHGMVQLLGELKADMNSSRVESLSPVALATLMRNSEGIRYLSSMGADLNVQMTTATPLHDAVRSGSVDMVQTLISSGASVMLSYRQKGLTALNNVLTSGHTDEFKVLVECGADVNLKSTRDISVLHDAIEYSDIKMVSTLMSLKGKGDVLDLVDQVTLLDDCCLNDNLTATEILLEHGVDKNCPQNFRVDLLDHAMRLCQFPKAVLLRNLGETDYCDTIGSSPLHTACRTGHIDQARLLIIAGCDVNKRAYSGKKPLELLPFTDTINYQVLGQVACAENVLEEVGVDHVPVVECESMMTILHTPGFGDVRYIAKLSTDEMSERVRNLLQCIPNKCNTFSSAVVKCIGSAAEGTKVGLPTEMDFLFEMNLEKSEDVKLEEAGFGYVRYMQQDCYNDYFRKVSKLIPKSSASLELDLNFKGSAGFHNEFLADIKKVLIDLRYETTDQKVAIEPDCAPNLKYTDRKACTAVLLRWNDGKTRFHISVDIVPSLHVDDWPEGAVTKTWLMDSQELRSRGYVLVPKPPHLASDLAEKFTEHELQTLWKILFPHLETEHMLRLEQRIKDVYLTAKCLRNPDVCRILITENASLPKNVDKYVTSYSLKMIFFKNVEYFQQSELSLGAMVLKLYEDLHQALSEGFIPIFFLPKVNALSGTKLDVSKCAKAANIMRQFVGALYHRDRQHEVGEETQGLSNERKPKSVYRTYEIGSR